MKDLKSGRQFRVEELIETLERRSETNRNVSIDSINNYTDKV